MGVLVSRRRVPVAVEGMLTLFEDARREKARQRDRRWKEAHPEARKAALIRYAAANRDKMRAARQRWIDAHPEKDAEAKQRWLESNREKRRGIARRWDKRNPQSRADRRAIRRARELAAYVEYIDRTAVYRRDGGVCQICRRAVSFDDFHVDHIVPLSRGGEHSYANVQLAHPACNLAKGARIEVSHVL